MKEYKKEDLKKKTHKLSKLGFRLMAVLSGILITGVGILCTSPSKAAEETPYFPPDDGSDVVTDAQTTAKDTETYHYAETLAPMEIDGITYEDTEPDDVQTKAEEPTDTETDADTGEYPGREYAENETFVGEYKTDSVYVSVSNVREGDLSYYICDITVGSVKDLHTAFANNSLAGRAYTSKIAASVDAGFAVNGDFCGFRTYGIIIREGGLYRNKKADDWDLCYIDKNGDLIVCKNDLEDGKALVDDGAWQSWCFGPTLVDNYVPLAREEFNTPDLHRDAREPRTAIGQIDGLHYIILVVDAKRPSNGMGGWNTVGGMTFSELAQTFAGLGCKTAYNLDGGASTTLYLNGEVVNEPAGNGERQISDIIYLK